MLFGGALAAAAERKPPAQGIEQFNRARNRLARPHLIQRATVLAR
jgi:hypothetical protein